MIKKTTLFAATLTALTASSLAFADAVPTTPIQTPAPDTHRVVVAIQELGNRIEGLSKASVKSVNELAYQIDKSFTSSMQLNNKQDDIQNRTREQIRLETDRAVKRSLQPFSNNTLTYTNKSQPEVKKANAEAQQQANYINRLKNVEASDTIRSLVQGMEVSTYWTKKNIGSPDRNDDAFNFAVLVEPESYNPEQALNSENFIGYAAKQYQTPADGINLGQLRNALMQYQKQGVKTLSQQIDQFRNNEAYKNYQLTIRSMTAAKSVATEIFTSLAAERKPLMTSQPDQQLEDISRAMGVEPQTVKLKGPDGEDVTMYRYASPMQIASYQASYRLKDPKWYQEVASDSAENLQRKNTILLAEISRQLHQSHLDNEKMMGALAMMNLQMGEVANASLKLQVNDVNAAISSFANAANGSSNSSNDNSSQPTTSTTPSTSTVPPSTDSYNANDYSSSSAAAAAATAAATPPPPVSQ